MTDKTANDIWTGPALGAPLPVRVLARVTKTLVIWHERARQRRILESLDDRSLRDMGINRGDAWQEYSKPFWRE